jgi:hypothetical protein
MNRQEAARIMKMLKAAYPNFDNSASPADIMALWLWRFSDTPFKVVFEAVGDYIDGDHSFAPTVGQIKKIIADKKPKLSAEEAWQEIEGALKNAGRDCEAEFAKLSPPVKAYVKSPGVLRHLATAPYSSGEYDDYQARFFKFFKGGVPVDEKDDAALNQAPETAKLGGSDQRMQKLVANLDQKMREKDKEEEEKKKKEMKKAKMQKD